MEKHEPDYVENARLANTSNSAKLSFKQKLKRHCSRFWWLHIIIFIIVVLVIVLPIVFVGFPRLAQKEVNKSVIVITSLSMLNPTPDSFDLDLVEVLYTESKYHPHLDAFNASLFLEGHETPFASVEVPEMQAQNGSESRIQQRVVITDQGAFTEYTKTVLHNDELAIVLRGRGGLKQGGLPRTNVDYNKRITMKGFDGLKELSIIEFNLMTESLPDGSNSNGTVSIPNPTVMTLALGNVSMAMAVDGVSVGTSTIPNLILVPGNNLIPMFAIANQTAVLELIQNPQYDPSALPITIIGNTSIYDGKELSYYSQALQENELVTPLNVTKTLIDAGFGFVLGNITTESGN